MKKKYKKHTGRNTKNLLRSTALLLGLSAFNANAQYCSSNATNGADEEIYNVMVNGAVTNPLYSFTNGCSTIAPGVGSLLNRYSNFMSLGSSFTVTQGVVSTFSISQSECDGSPFFNNGAAIWIDYNQDSDFLDAGEQVFVENATTIGPRSINGTFIAPFSVPTGTTVMRVIVREGAFGANINPCGTYGWGETEDYIITVAAGVQCVSTPGANTIVPTTTLVCPVFGTSNFTLANTYTVGGIGYQWMQSTSSGFGPWVNATGTSTQSAYTTPTLAATTWYQLVANCVWGGSSNTLTSIQINVAGSTTNTVPYFEGFEGISQNKDLPNCSWTRSDNYQCGSRTSSVNAWRAARTGNKFAEFDASNNVFGQTRYFYSNGILLNAGITYSASVWYNTQGNSTWNPSLLYGPNQSPTGLVQLAAINNPNNTTYNSLSGTFSVSTTGLYYLAIKGQENFWGSQLVWDDLSIIAPCQFANNAAAIALSGTTAICAGQSASIAASGASSYTWSNGANGNVINVSPLSNTIYTVTGINPLSGCLGTATREIVVNQLPPISIYAVKTSVCEGESLTIQAFSANSYTWSAGPSFNAAVTVTPTMANNTYTVIGSNNFGCIASAVQQIAVNPIPVISVSGATLICNGHTTNLTASGAGNNGAYEWKAGNLYLQSSVAIIAPEVTTSYSVVGTDDSGCKGTTIVIVAVDPCLGLQNLNGSDSNNLLVYPNPNNGQFTIEALAGKIVLHHALGEAIKTATSDGPTKILIRDVAKGIYFITHENRGQKISKKIIVE